MLLQDLNADLVASFLACAYAGPAAQLCWPNPRQSGTMIVSTRPAAWKAVVRLTLLALAAALLLLLQLVSYPCSGQAPGPHALAAM